MVAFRNPNALGKVAQPKQDNSKKGEFLRQRCERVKSTCGRRKPAVKRARLSLYVYISGEEVRFPGPPGARSSVTPLTKNNSGSQPFRTVFWPRLRKTPPMRPKTVPGLLRDAPRKPQTIECICMCQRKTCTISPLRPKRLQGTRWPFDTQHRVKRSSKGPETFPEFSPLDALRRRSTSPRSSRVSSPPILKETSATDAPRWAQNDPRTVQDAP